LSQPLYARILSTSRTYRPIEVIERPLTQAALPSIQERHVPHGPRSGLGIHLHAVPAGEHERSMVRVADSPAHEGSHVAPEDAPWPGLRRRVVVEELFVLFLRETIGVAFPHARGDIDGLAA